MVGHCAGIGDHQAVLDLGTTGFCGGARVDEGDGDLPIHRAADCSGVSDLTHIGDVGVDRLEVAQSAAPVVKDDVFCGCDASKVGGVAVHIGRSHEQEATSIRVGLVVVVGHIEGVALTVDQWLAVARCVVKDVGNDFALEVIRFAI